MQDNRSKGGVSQMVNWTIGMGTGTFPFPAEKKRERERKTA